MNALADYGDSSGSDTEDHKPSEEHTLHLKASGSKLLTAVQNLAPAVISKVPQSTNRSLLPIYITL